MRARIEFFMILMLAIGARINPIMAGPQDPVEHATGVDFQKREIEEDTEPAAESLQKDAKSLKDVFVKPPQDPSSKKGQELMKEGGRCIRENILQICGCILIGLCLLLGIWRLIVG